MRKMFLSLLDVSDLFLSVLDVSTQTIKANEVGDLHRFQAHALSTLSSM